MSNGYPDGRSDCKACKGSGWVPCQRNGRHSTDGCRCFGDKRVDDLSARLREVLYMAENADDPRLALAAIADHIKDVPGMRL